MHHLPGFGWLPVDEVAQLGVDLDGRPRLRLQVQLLVLYCGGVAVVRGKVDNPEGPPVDWNFTINLQGSAKRWSLGLVNFVAALAYHLCLPLPATFTKSGTTF